MCVRQRLIQHFQAELGIADQRHIRRIIGAGHRGVDVEVNDLALSRRGMAPALGGHRAGAAADENDQIGLIDDRARLGRAAVGADDADGQRMRLR